MKRYCINSCKIKSLQDSRLPVVKVKRSNTVFLYDVKVDTLIDSLLKRLSFFSIVFVVIFQLYGKPTSCWIVKWGYFATARITLWDTVKRHMGKYFQHSNSGSQIISNRARAVAKHGGLVPPKVIPPFYLISSENSLSYHFPQKLLFLTEYLKNMKCLIALLGV